MACTNWRPSHFVLPWAENTFLHALEWGLSCSMNSLATVLRCAAEAYVSRACRNAQGLHENPKWKVTVWRAKNLQKRQKTWPDGGNTLTTKQGIFLPGKVTHRTAGSGQEASATGSVRERQHSERELRISALVAPNRFCPRRPGHIRACEEAKPLRQSGVLRIGPWIASRPCRSQGRNMPWDNVDSRTSSLERPPLGC